MMRAGIIGHPVGHSKSPLIHNHWMERYGIEGIYQAIDVMPEKLAESVKKLVDSGYAGFNVTVPHKVAVMDLCDTIDETARAIGAINTVVIEGGKLSGRNTDAFGFIENLKAAQPDRVFKKAFVLGAGGAARAAVYALLRDGVEDFVLCNRSRDKAQTIQQMAPDKIFVQDWDRRHELQDVDLLVNTTSLGMTGKDPLEIDLASLPQAACVYDIVYAPLMTDLLKAAENKGCAIVTGIGMLLQQARPAFAAWASVLPAIDDDLLAKVMP